MNLKERGITVGDLILVLVFVFSIVFIINKVKDSDKQAYLQLTQNNSWHTNIKYF